MQKMTPPDPGRSTDTGKSDRSFALLRGSAKSLPLWAELLAASLTCQVVSYWVKHPSFEVVRFGDRIIDPNQVRGVDFAATDAVYGVAIVLSIFGFLAITRALSALVMFDRKTVGSGRIKVETHVIGVLSAFAIVLLCLSALENPRKGLDQCAPVLYAGIFLSLTMAVLKGALVRRSAGEESYRLPGYSALIGLVLCCTVIPFVYGGFLNEPCTLEWEALVAVCFAVFSLTGLYVIACPRLLRRLGIGKARFDNLLTTGLAPLMLVPLALPLSNELQFSLSGISRVHPRTIWAVLVLLLIAASASLFAATLNRRPLCRASKLVKHYYFPIVVLTSATLVNFDHFLKVGPAIDMFHWGELVVPVQQLFQFHSIPFVDLLPTHGLRDILIQLFYSLVNGYRGIEILLWSYGLNVAMAVLFYFLVARVFSPLFALLVSLAIPLCNVLTLQGPDYCVFLAVALCLCRVTEAPTVRNVTILWMTVSFAFWWRYDLGLFSMAACLLVMPGFLMGKGRREWTAVILSACALGLVQIVFFWLLAAVRGRSAPELVMQLWHHLKILSSGHGFGTIWPAWNATAFMMYCVLPAVCVGYIVYFLHQRLSLNRPLPRIAYMLVFLATVSLLLSFRNLHRHGMMESYKSLFAVFLLGAIPVMTHLSKRGAELAFLALIVVHTMVLGPYSWLTPTYSQRVAEDARRVLALQRLPETNFKTGPVFAFHPWHEKESRLKDLSDWQFRGLKPFFDSVMTRDQTFYDFSCATLLYAVTDREVVSFVLQGQVHTGEPVQRYELARMRAKYDAGCLPFVTFKQGTKWDVLDGVPNELYSYLLAEFIYRHYRPLGYVGSFQTWVANTYNRPLGPAEEPRRTPLPLRQDFEVKNGLKVDAQESGLAWRSSGPQTGVLHFVDVRGVPLLDKDHYWFLRLVCRSSGNGQVSAYFVRAGDKGQSSVIGLSARADVHESSGDAWQDVIFRIPISTMGRPDRLADVILNTPSNAAFAIKSAEILCTADPLFPRISRVEQRLDFGSLPQLWADYDKDRAWEKTRVLGTKPTRQVCEPGKGLPLSFGPVEDKDTGNYLHLKIQSDHPTQAAVVVPGEPESWIAFKVTGSVEPRDYVIRISCLWAWMQSREAQVTIRAQQPIWVQEAVLRKGD